MMSGRFQAIPTEQGVYVLDQYTGEMRLMSPQGVLQISPPWGAQVTFQSAPPSPTATVVQPTPVALTPPPVALAESVIPAPIQPPAQPPAQPLTLTPASILTPSALQTVHDQPTSSPPAPEQSIIARDADTFDHEVVNTYPYMVAKTYLELLNERDPRLRCKLMVDTFTALLKLWAVQMASEYFRAEDVKDVGVNKTLQRDLSRPLISAWNLLIFRTLPVLKDAQVPLFAPELERCYQTLESKCKDRFIISQEYSDSEGKSQTRAKKLGKIQAMINYRNGLAHGFNQSKKQALRDLETYLPLLKDILKESRFITRYPLYLSIKCEGTTLGQVKARRLMGAQPQERPVDLKLPLTSAEDAQLFLYNEASGDALPLYTFLVSDRAEEGNLPGLDQDVFLFEGTTKNTVIYISAHGEHTELAQRLTHWRNLLKKKALELKALDTQNLSFEALKSATQFISDRSLEALIQSGKYLRTASVERTDLKAHLDTFKAGRFSAFLLGGESGIGKSTLLAKWVEDHTTKGDAVAFYRASALSDVFVGKRLLRDLGMSHLFIEDFLSLCNPLFSNADRSADSDHEVRSEIGSKLDSGRRFYIVIDALNEFAGDLSELLSQLESLVQQCHAYPWARLVMSVRNSSYLRLSSQSKLGHRGLNPYYTIEVERGIEKVITPLVSLLPLKLDELEPMVEAYRDYLQPDPDDPSLDGVYRFRPLNAFNELDPKGSTRLLCKHPLMARLILEAFHRRTLPSHLHYDHAMRLYLERVIVEQGRPGGDFIDRRRFLTQLTTVLDALETDAVPRDQLIEQPSLRGAMLNPQRDSAYVQLLELGVLLEEWEGDTCLVRFAFDRLFEFFLAERYDLKVDSAQDIKALIARSIEFSNLLGAVDSLLMRACEQGRETLLVDLLDLDFDEDVRLKGLTIKLCKDLLLQLQANSHPSFFRIIKSLPDDPSETDVEMLTLLCDELELRGEVEALSVSLEVLLAEARLLGTPAPLSAAFIRLGMFTMARGNPQEAMTHLDQALHQANLSKDQELIAQTTLRKGELVLNTEGAQSALSNFLEARDLFKNTSNHLGLGLVDKFIGTIYKKLGNMKDAYQSYTQSLKYFNLANSSIEEARALNNLGSIERANGNLNKAKELYLKSLEIKDNLGDKRGVAYSLINLGNIFNDLSEVDKSEECYAKALSIVEYINDKPGLSASYGNLGVINERKGYLTQANDYYQKAYALSLKMNDRLRLSRNMYNIGKLKVRLGLFTEAEQLFVESLSIRKELNAKADLSMTYYVLADLQRQTGDYQNAHQNYLLAIEGLESYKGSYEVEEVIFSLVSFYIESGDQINASLYLEKMKNIKPDSTYYQTDHLLIKLLALNESKVIKNDVQINRLLERLHKLQHSTLACLGEWIWLMSALVDKEVDQGNLNEQLDQHIKILETLAQRLNTPIELAMLAYARLIVAEHHEDDAQDTLRTQAQEAFNRLPTKQVLGIRAPA